MVSAGVLQTLQIERSSIEGTDFCDFFDQTTIGDLVSNLEDIEFEKGNIAAAESITKYVYTNGERTQIFFVCCVGIIQHEDGCHQPRSFRWQKLVVSYSLLENGLFEQRVVKFLLGKEKGYHL